jgi:hypothetical protein
LEFWEREGFGSLEEFMDEYRASWERIGWSPRKRRRDDLPEPSLPDGQVPAQRLARRDRQVNMRLTGDDHAKLEEAAKLYGVRPATMAQLLVNRGVRAVLEREAG